MRSRSRHETSREVAEPRRLRLAIHGAEPEEAETWLAALRRAGVDVQVAAAGGASELRAGLRQPLDMTLAWDDAAGERALEALDTVREEGLAVRVVVVAHPEAPGAAVRCLEQGAYGVLDADRPERLPPMAVRLLDDLHRETVAALTGRIVHDLDNLLAPIPLALRLLHDRGLPGRLAGHVATIDDAVRGSMAALRGLSELILTGQSRLLEVPAKHLVAIAATRMRDGLGGTRNVLSEYPPGLAAIRLDATRALEVLACLGRRVLDAAQDEDELVYRGSDVALSPSRGGGAATATVEIVVAAGRATEAGVETWEASEEHEDLATVREIVAAADGTAQVGRSSESAAARAYRLSFPAAAPAVGSGAGTFRAPSEVEARGAAAPSPAPSATGPEEILVIDDEEDVRRVTCEVLESRGYRALEAAGGAEGVALLADGRGRVALCLVDLGLPRMDGASTVRALRRTDPAVRIVVTSGSDRDAADLDRELGGVDGFLAKPYDAETLIRAIGDALAEG